MQHSNKHTCNIRLKRQMKHLERTLATYVYNHCNICNISVSFCNIHMKHLQHTSETSETYSCNMRFQHNISLLLDKMEARRCVVFTGGSDLAALVGSGPAAVATCLHIVEGRHRLHERQGGRDRATWRGQLRRA
jgi:hypothetical protein